METISAILRFRDKRQAVLPGVSSFGSAEIAGLRSSYRLKGSCVIGLEQHGALFTDLKSQHNDVNIIVVSEGALPFITSYLKSARCEFYIEEHGAGYVVLRIKGAPLEISLCPNEAQSALIWPVRAASELALLSHVSEAAVYVPARGESSVGLCLTGETFARMNASGEYSTALSLNAPHGMLTIPTQSNDKTLIGLNVEAALTAYGASVSGSADPMIFGFAVGSPRHRYWSFGKAESVIGLQGTATGYETLVVSARDAIVVDSYLTTGTILTPACEMMPNVIGVEARSDHTSLTYWEVVGAYDDSTLSKMDTVTLSDLERVVIE